MKYSLRNLWLEPYRPFFLVGALMAISVGIHWFYFFQPTDVSSALLNRPPIQMHAFQMLYCTFSYFAFGFLLTAFPRWLEAHPVSRFFSLPCLLSLVGSEVLLFLGARFPQVYPLLGALEIWLFGGIFVSLVRRLPRSPRMEPVLVLAGIFLGGTGALMGVWGLCFP